MRSKELKWTIITGVILLLSLVSGGAVAIIAEGIIYDIVYAIHKISSVLAGIFFVVSVRLHGKEKSL